MTGPIIISGLFGVAGLAVDIEVIQVAVLAALFAVWGEYFVFIYGRGNRVLRALPRQVFAFRCSSFGYLPALNYLLIGSNVLNVGLINGAGRILDDGIDIITIYGRKFSARRLYARKR